MRPGRERGCVGACPRKRAAEFLPPVCNVSSRCITVEHAHRGLADVGDLVEDSRGDIDRLSAFQCLPFRSKAHLCRAFDDIVDLFLFLIVPGNLSTPRLQRDMTHGEVLRLDWGCTSNEILCPPPGGVPPSFDMTQICNNHTAALRTPFVFIVMYPDLVNL